MKVYSTHYLNNLNERAVPEKAGVNGCPQRRIEIIVAPGANDNRKVQWATILYKAAPKGKI